MSNNCYTIISLKTVTMDQENQKYKIKAYSSFIYNNPNLTYFPTVIDMEALHNDTPIPLTITNNSEN